jgi:hypothetical protein
MAGDVEVSNRGVFIVWDRVRDEYLSRGDDIAGFELRGYAEEAAQRWADERNSDDASRFSVVRVDVWSPPAEMGL